MYYKLFFNGAIKIKNTKFQYNLGSSTSHIISNAFASIFEYLRPFVEVCSNDFTLSANRNLMTPLCSNDELFASLVVISIYHHTYSNLKINKFCCK